MKYLPELKEIIIIALRSGCVTPGRVPVMVSSRGILGNDKSFSFASGIYSSPHFSQKASGYQDVR